jgi:putative hydrolase of the HAD superfamily
MSKPDRRIYALTCERLGLSPEEVIFLDDREAIIDAACEFGIHGILFQENTQAIADIQACIQANAA